MKIGMVSEFYDPLPGGISEHIRSISRELTVMGHEVVILTGSQGNGSFDSDPRVVRIGRSVPVRYNGSLSRISVGWRLEHRLRRIFERERFDLLHVHNPLMPTLPLMTLRCAPCPLVATFHSNYPRDLLVSSFRRPLARLLRRVRVLLPVSLAAYRTVGISFPGDYRIVPNGVDFDQICRAVQGQRGPRPGDGRTLRILFVGALVPRKGLPVLIEAFTHLRRRGLRVELTIVGAGPNMGAARRRVPREAREQVRFLGLASRREVLESFARADLFCAPSLGRESFGIVLLEAMAAGLPVVASDIEGYQDVVTHGVEGVLVPPGEAGALADALESLLRAPEERIRMGRAGQIKAEKLRWSGIARRLDDIYLEVMKRGPAPETADLEFELSEGYLSRPEELRI